jgi:hypothetical protein
MKKYRFHFNGVDPVIVEDRTLTAATRQLDTLHPDLGGSYTVEVFKRGSWVRLSSTN